MVDGVELEDEEDEEEGEDEGKDQDDPSTNSSVCRLRGLFLKGKETGNFLFGAI